MFRAIHDGGATNDVLVLKYLEALRAIADGQATKIFLPTEMSGLFGVVGGLAEMLRPENEVGQNGSGDSDGAAAIPSPAPDTGPSS